MNSAAVSNLAVAAVVLTVSVVLIWRCRRADRLQGQPYMRAIYDESERQWVNQEEHPVGPDNLRLLQDLEADLKAYAATVADFYDTTTGER